MGPLRHLLVIRALTGAAVVAAPVGAAHALILSSVDPEDDALGELPDPIPAAPSAVRCPVAQPIAAASDAGVTAPAAARPPAGAQSAADAARAVAAQPRAPAPPPGPPADGARKVQLTLPLEIELHGRFLMDVSADERDDWGRSLGVSSARLGFEARLPGVKTVVEADLASTPMLVEAYVRLDGPARTRLTAGRFKAPFSERRLDSIWSLPVVERGLVDHYLVKRNGLGGRRVGLAGTWRPWDGKIDATGGLFVGDGDALEAGSDAGKDWAGRVAVRPWHAVELGVSGYRAGAGAGATALPTRYAAAAFANLDLGPVRTALEGFTGGVTEGPFTAGTALVSWRLRVGGDRRLRVTPVAGAEALEVRGATPGVGYGAITGAVISWAEGLKVKVQGEWARRAGDPAPAKSIAVEVGSRF